MAQDKNEPGKGGALPGLGGGPVKRTTAMIDLEAKEIERRDMPGSDKGDRAAAEKAASDKAPADKSTAGAASGAAAAAAAAVGASGAPGAKPSTGAGASAGGTGPSAAKDAGGAKPGEAARSTSSVFARNEPRAKSAEPRRLRRRGVAAVGSSHLGAGVAGALLAVFGVDYAANQLGLPVPLPASREMQALTTRLGTLEALVKEKSSDATETVTAEKVDALTGRLAEIDALKAALDAFGRKQTELEVAAKGLGDKLAAVPATAPLDPAALVRLEKLETTIATLAAEGASENSGKLPQLAALVGKINDIRTEMDARLTALKEGLSKDIIKQRADLEQQLADTSHTEAIATLEASSIRLGRDLESVKLAAERLDRLIKSTDDDTRAAKAQLEAVKSEAMRVSEALTGLKSEIEGRIAGLVSTGQLAEALKPTEAAIAGMKSELAVVTDREKTREQGASRILLTLELGNLRRAIERGGAYARELGQVRSLAPAGIDLKALEASAETGIEPLAELQSQFRSTAGAILDADAARETDESLLGQLWSGARSIVRVRKTGEIAGDTAEAIVARMEVALEDGRLDAVLAESKGLTPEALKAAEPWLGKVAARQAVDTAIGTLEDNLKQLMGASASN